MEYVNNEIVDITFVDNTMIIHYDNGEKESLPLNKETYEKMYRAWLVDQPPFISDIYKQKYMVNIIKASIHNDQGCIEELNNNFQVDNKDEVIKFLKYMRVRDLTQEKLKWNQPFNNLYNKLPGKK
jgi:hypothetical protein